jgi:hypothetical protein
MTQDNEWIDDFYTWHELHPERVKDPLARLNILGITARETLAVWVREEMPVPPEFVELMGALAAEAKAKKEGRLRAATFPKDGNFPQLNEQAQEIEKAQARRARASNQWVDAKERILSDVHTYILNNPKVRSGVIKATRQENFPCKLGEWIKKQKEPVTKSAIFRAFQTKRAMTIDLALKELIQEGKIAEIATPPEKPGRPTKVYRFIGAIALCLLLANCASDTVWTKPGATGGQFNQAAARCRFMVRSQQMALPDDPGAVNALGNWMMLRDNYEDCMRMQGWRLENLQVAAKSDWVEPSLK